MTSTTDALRLGPPAAARPGRRPAVPSVPRPGRPVTGPQHQGAPQSGSGAGVAVGATGEQAARGEAVAADFDTFYAATFRILTVQLYAYVGSTSEAQDIAQEAFCRAWQRWAVVSTYDEPVAWVRRVAWNLATSRWRRSKTALAFVRRHREEHSPELSPDRVMLVAALKQLPANHRQALVLHYLADCSIVEIAAQTGAAEGTVKSWLHRGRAELAEVLAEVRHG